MLPTMIPLGAPPQRTPSRLVQPRAGEEGASRWPTMTPISFDARSASGSKPHVVFYLADDLGWADVGFQLPASVRGEPETPSTPHIDALALDGVVLKRLYAHKLCAPSRMAIQSGRSPLFVGATNDGMVDFNLADDEGGFQGIPRHMTGLGTVMRRGGYETHFVGKCAMTPPHGGWVQRRGGGSARPSPAGGMPAPPPSITRRRGAASIPAATRTLVFPPAFD